MKEFKIGSRKCSPNILFSNELFPKEIRVLIKLDPVEIKLPSFRINEFFYKSEEMELMLPGNKCSAINMKINKVEAIINEHNLAFEKEILILDDNVFLIDPDLLKNGFVKKFKLYPKDTIEIYSNNVQDGTNVRQFYEFNGKEIDFGSLMIPLCGFFNDKFFTRSDQLYILCIDRMNFDIKFSSDLQNIYVPLEASDVSQVSYKDSLINDIKSGSLEFDVQYQNTKAELMNGIDVFQKYKSNGIVKSYDNGEILVSFYQSNDL